MFKEIQKMRKSVVVIGAGIAGLAAAYQLQQAGMFVHVLEANDYVGGRMFTVDWEGFRVDGGAKFVTTADRTLLAMVSELGLDDQLVKSGSGLDITIYRDGQLHSANFLSILSYLRWSGVSPLARLAMFKLVLPMLLLGKVNPYHLERAHGPDDEVTFEQFFKNKISVEMFEYWARPMFETMCAYKGDDLSRKAFLALMASYLNSSSVTFRDGVGALPEELARRLNVELSAQVIDIMPYSDKSGAVVIYRSRSEGIMKRIWANKVVVAIPGNHVLELFDDPLFAWNRFFPLVKYTSGALHYHVIETDYRPPVVRTLVPRLSGLPINSIAFEQYRDGRWLMLTDPSVYGFRIRDSDGILEQKAVGVIRQIFPQMKGDFIAHRMFRWHDMLPTFKPGYLVALSEFWADPQEDPVFFCGDYFAGPSTGGALYTGLECAQRILKGN